MSQYRNQKVCNYGLYKYLLNTVYLVYKYKNITKPDQSHQFRASWPSPSFPFGPPPPGFKNSRCYFIRKLVDFFIIFNVVINLRFFLKRVYKYSQDCQKYSHSKTMVVVFFITVYSGIVVGVLCHFRKWQVTGVQCPILNYRGFL